jgi:3-oxoacyl-[acyl-carrier protein] reductase
MYEFAPLDAITPEHIQKHFNLNVAGLLLTTKEAIKLIGPEGGSISNIGSIVGPNASAASVYLQRKQSRGRCNYSFAFARAWSAKDPCELA